MLVTAAWCTLHCKQILPDWQETDGIVISPPKVTLIVWAGSARVKNIWSLSQEKRQKPTWWTRKCSWVKSSGKKPLVQVIVNKDDLHCWRCPGPCSLLQRLCVTGTGAGAEQQRQILTDLPLWATAEGISPWNASRSWDPVTLSKAVVAFCGWAEAAPHSSCLIPSFPEPHHRAQGPGVCASASPQPGPSPALNTQFRICWDTLSHTEPSGDVALLYCSKCLSSCISTNLLVVSFIDSPV